MVVEQECATRCGCRYETIPPGELTAPLLLLLFLQDGQSNWLKGLTLILAYFVVAASFFFHKDNKL